MLDFCVILQTVGLHYTVGTCFIPLFFFGLFIFPSVLQQLFACLMYQSFRWGVTAMALCF